MLYFLYKNRIFQLVILVILGAFTALFGFDSVGMIIVYTIIGFVIYLFLQSISNMYCARKTKRIFKWFHRPLLQIPLCLPKYRLNMDKTIEKTFVFDKHLITSEYHINKLFGTTVGGFFENSIHKNSFRFGWTAKLNGVEIYAYYYIDGVRHIDLIKVLDYYKRYTFLLHRDENSFVFLINSNNKMHGRFIVPFVSEKSGGYLAELYYGGESVSPKTLVFKEI